MWSRWAVHPYSPMDLSSFHNQFREETAENIRVLSDGLLALESANDATERRAIVDRIFRAVHTVKGSARMLGFEPISRLAHALEHLLDELRQGRRTLDRPLTDGLLRGGDAILALAAVAGEAQTSPVDVDALIASLPAQAQPAPRPDAASARTVPAPEPTLRTTPARMQQQTVRVRVDRLNRLLNLAGELVVGQQVFANHLDELRALQGAVERQVRALSLLEDELARLRFSPAQRQALDRHLAAARAAADSTIALAQEHGERFTRHSGQHQLLVQDLEREVIAARLLPIATVYSGLPRAVRDLAQATGKQVRLELHGETVELDRKVLELITDPLLHLVRNAVDHGLEAAAERVAAGKPPEGVVTVSAEAADGDVRVIVTDDGQGIDPARIRAQAVRLGLLSTEAAGRLADHEALELIFAPGFSTAGMVTDISGRGVGMDVVRTNLAELGGQVHIEAQPGHGTRITLSLPLTLVTTRVLLVQVGRSSYALPASGCQGTIWVQRGQIQSLEGQPTFEHEGRTVALLALADVLGIEAPRLFSTDERMSAVLTGSPQRPVALLVDALLDEREVVVKPLGALLAPQRRFGGAVQLGDGSLVLLLNPLVLAQQARAVPLPAPELRQPRRLLVADDSFTTRELIRSILQSAGYEVTVAVDGADALDILSRRPIDLVVSDVEMPRLNGFELAARIRADRQLCTVPVVLITSLAAEQHRRRGLEAGAQAYIVKSQFDQESLLDVVRQLLNGGR